MNAPPLPLQGRVIVVTRPREQAGELAAGIRALGGEAWLFPLLEITPCPDPAPLLRIAARLPEYRFAVFVSANAVRHALPSLPAGADWPAHLRAVAVGAGTARALAAAGVTDCLFPSEGADSEHLLALPEFSESAVRGQKIAIFRGGGGRELLAQTLTARGAEVDYVPVYQRSGPNAGQAEFCAQLAAGRFDALTLSSSEALQHLLDLAGHLPSLRATPLFAPHARITDKARAAGFTHVISTKAEDSGLLAGLGAYAYNRQLP
ncbi:MAG: uroporphyrinogen-III synthase [Zoogloeaceae bacterium]|nr:uroporphyrinogen-III synthase [Zoogloeaceae bacterium]